MMRMLIQHLWEWILKIAGGECDEKVEAIIRQEKLEAIKAAIDQEIEVNGMTVSQVLGCGLQKVKRLMFEDKKLSLHYCLRFQ